MKPPQSISSGRFGNGPSIFYIAEYFRIFLTKNKVTIFSHLLVACIYSEKTNTQSSLSNTAALIA